MENTTNKDDGLHSLSLNIDRSTCDYYENLYSIPVDSMSTNTYGEAEYGNNKNLYERVDPNCP